MGIYMGFLILGATLVHGVCFFKLFFMVGKELIQSINPLNTEPVFVV